MLKKLLTLVCLALFLSVSASAETAESILEKSFEAYGGKVKYSEIKTMSMDMKMSFSGMDIVMKYSSKDKTKMRMESSMFGMKMISVVTENSGWASQNGTITDYSPEQLEQEREKMKSQTSFMNEEFMNWKELGYTVELIGEEAVDGSPAYKMKMLKEGNELIQYIDKATYLAIKMTAKENKNGEETTNEIFIQDYKDVNGFKIPHLMKIFTGGVESGKIIFENFKINEPIDDKLFTKP